MPLGAQIVIAQPASLALSLIPQVPPAGNVPLDVLAVVHPILLPVLAARMDPS